jgi:hypothetical protein
MFSDRAADRGTNQKKKTASCATSAVQEGVPPNGKEWNVGAGPNTPRHNATAYFTAGKIEDTRNSSLLLPIRHRVE